MKKNYKILICHFLMAVSSLLSQYSYCGTNSKRFVGVGFEKTLFSGCTGTGIAASQGSFTTGYSYTFSTVGNTVQVTATLLDTNKVGVVAYAFTQMPFSETPMSNSSGLTFNCSISGQPVGQTIGIAIKFAYSNGMSVTQYISYVVGNNCSAAPTDTQAPTAFTAVAGSVTSSSVELLLNATDDSGAITYTISNGTATTTATGSSGVQQSVIINNLTPETAYGFTVTAKDAANNTAANSPLTVNATTLEDTTTACAGTKNGASEGSFSTGYSYVFSTTGNTVNVSVTLLDTNKTGVVAYVRTQMPFSETPIANAGGLTFTGTLTGQPVGQTIGIAFKFAYAGGMAVTQYINYVVGENCTGGGDEDIQAPTDFTAIAGTITTSSVELLLEATDDSGSVNYSITYGATTVTATGTSGEVKSVIINNLTPGTAYAFTVTAKDAAYNIADNAPITVNAPTLVDTNTACSGTSAQAQGAPGFSTGYTYDFATNGTTVTATFTLLDTDKTGVVAYLWSVAPNFAESEVLYGNPGLTFTKTISGLTPGSVIQLAMKFAYAGNASTTKYFTYTVGDTCGAVSSDTQAPTNFTAYVGDVTSTSVQLLLNANDDSGNVIYTITHGSTTLTASGTSGEEKSVLINNLNPETDYNFIITAKDAANNMAANNPIEVEAITLEDTNTACAGTSSQALGATSFTTGYTYSFVTTGSSITATFTLLDTDKAGVSAYLWKTPPFQEITMSHVSGQTFSATVDGLTIGNEYNFAVKFAYANGQIETKYFTYEVGDNCDGSEDTEAPQDFTAEVGEVSTTSVELLLNATDNSGEVKYDIVYGSNTLSVTGGSGVEKSVLITGLTDDTHYSFSVSASDEAGNHAVNNALILDVTTPEQINTQCSGISSQASEGVFSTGYSYGFVSSGSDVTITFTLLDADKTGVVAYLRKETPLTETAMTHVSGNTFTLTLPNQVPGTTISYAVKFAFAGGQAITQYYTYLVGNNCDGIPLNIVTTWNGTAWSNGIPSSDIYTAVIQGDFDSSHDGEIVAGSLTVNSGDVIIASNDNFIIRDALEVDSEATFTLQHNANLIQIDDTENTGVINVEKNSAPMYRLDYALWGSPVAGQMLQAFSPQTLNNRFYTYNPVSDAYSLVANPATTSFNTGKGYLIRVANNHPAYVNDETDPVSWSGVFTGVPNNGDIDVSVIPAFDAFDDEDDITGFNAISNPYPSAINIAEFFEENQDRLATTTPIFFWRKKNGTGTSSYCSLTLAGYNANSGNVLGDSSNGVFANPNDSDDWVINSGQGFIVRAISGTVSFKNSMRRSVNNSQMFRDAMEGDVSKSRLWLNITNGEGLFGQTTIAYTPNTTLGLDYGWDGKAFTDGDVAIYSITGETKLGIHARGNFDVSDEVAVECKVTTAGEYSISLDHFDGVFEQGQDIFLRDNLLGITHNLKLAPYSFTSDLGVTSARFDVVYAEALNTGTPEFNSNSLIAYKQGNAINISTGNTDIKAVSVCDVHGRLLYSAKNVNAATTSITTLQAQSQMLIVQVETTQGIKVSRKIVF